MAAPVVNARIEVNGLAETLRTLRTVDPVYGSAIRQATIKKMKTAAKPLIADARGLFPNTTPLSGWGTWTGKSGKLITDAGGYDPARVDKGVKVAFKGSANKRNINPNVVPLLTLRQVTNAGVIFDMAGKKNAGKTPQGRAMIRELMGIRPPSRAMWEVVEKRRPMIEREVKAAIDDMMDEINRRLR